MHVCMGFTGGFMGRFLRLVNKGVVAGIALVGWLSGAAPASAAENVTGDLGISYNTHFISYGLDVWGGGTDFYGDRATTFIYGDLFIKVTDSLTISFGAWADINRNVPSAIGGSIQEIDVYPGITYTVGMFTLGATYQAWSYAGDVEESIDLSVAFNDMGLIWEGFGFNPKLVWHNRVSGNGAQTVGSAFVASIGPSFALAEGLTLSIPAGVAFFTTDDFQGGIDASGYGYSYAGGSLAYAFGFVPPEYGVWTINFDLIAYFTDQDAIPTNPENSFLTGSVGLKVAY
jgi:hypothetical protein